MMHNTQPPNEARYNKKMTHFGSDAWKICVLNLNPILKNIHYYVAFSCQCGSSVTLSQLFNYMFRIKMIWSSVGLLLAVSLVNTKGLSIHGEEGTAIQGDEVEQELEVSEVMLLGGITDLFHNCEQNIINCFMRFWFVVIQVLEGMLGMGGRVKRDDRGITNYDIRWTTSQPLDSRWFWF